MQYIFLSEQFYKDYAGCPEIEQKQTRPYIMLILKFDGLTFALPLRSHIRHKYAFITDTANNCGVDYSKAVVITDKIYIDSKSPRIRLNEHKVLIKNSYIITKEFKKYLSDYKKAVRHGALRINYTYRYCSLQYFHKELGID